MAPVTGEFARIDRWFRPLAAGFPGALGLTDDAAVFAPDPGRELVVTMDALVAGVHFLPDDPPGDIAAKLLRVNLSDLAAMAADPLAYTLATALPRSIDDAWLSAFTDGLAADQRRFGIHLAGGDSVSTPGPVTLAVTAFGQVDAGRALRRSGARPGECLFVTGTIGDAALGLGVATGAAAPAAPADRAFLLERLRRPTPRLEWVALLRQFATAGIDISDGLVADVGHIAETSGCAVRMMAAAVPMSPAAARALAAGHAGLGRLLTGGDDYEIAFTASPAHRDAIARAAAAAGLAVHEIGAVEAGPVGQVTVIGPDGAPMPLDAAGWTHF